MVFARIVAREVCGGDICDGFFVDADMLCAMSQELLLVRRCCRRSLFGDQAPLVKVLLEPLWTVGRKVKILKLRELFVWSSGSDQSGELRIRAASLALSACPSIIEVPIPLLRSPSFMQRSQPSIWRI